MQAKRPAQTFKPRPAPPTGGGTPGGLKARRAELGGSAAAEMSVLRPMDKLPDLNRATILVGTEGALGRLPASPGPCASSGHSAPVWDGRAHTLDQSERRLAKLNGASTNRHAAGSTSCLSGRFSSNLGFPRSVGEAERFLGVSLPRFPFEPPLAGCIPSWGIQSAGSSRGSALLGSPPV